ncbi:MAG: hypothetical protein KatS3mg081_1901 [Gemmatimonadales bacterium]|nr:MAG: hypothetical protein KatS3mg081_1901 [Gemmatimonadales bacterium]
MRLLQRSLVAALLVFCPWEPAPAQDYRTTTASRRPAGEPDLSVTVEYGAGNFRLGSAAGPFLYRTSLRYDASLFRPVHEYDVALRRLTLGIEGLDGGIRVSKRELPEQRLEVVLSPEVPAELELTFGAGSAEIELGGMSLQSAAVRTGASETRVSFASPNRIRCEDLRFEVGAIDLRVSGLGNSRCSAISLKGAAADVTLDFSGEWPDSGSVSVDLALGMGSVTLEIPRSVGLSARVDRFLASFDRSGLRRRGERYYSADYDSARVKVDLDVKAALGSVEIRWRD